MAKLDNDPFCASQSHGPDNEDNDTQLAQRLRGAGLRPTRQRLAIASLLLDGRERHVSAESLALEVHDNGLKVASGTIYNTLNQFTDAGLLRRVQLSGERFMFDTNTCDHHHFYDSGSGELIDIPASEVKLGRIPEAPDGRAIEAVNVTIHIGPKARKPEAKKIEGK